MSGSPATCAAPSRSARPSRSSAVTGCSPGRSAGARAPVAACESAAATVAVCRGRASSTSIRTSSRRATTAQRRSRRGSHSAGPPSTQAPGCCSRRPTRTRRGTRSPEPPGASSSSSSAFPLVRSEAAEWGLDLRRGWEVYPSLLVDGADPEAYRLEGTRAVLVEFPGWWLQVDDAVELVAAAAERVERAGLVPLLAHPERCPAVATDPESARPLAESGWPLCLNGPSLTGDHGANAERAAWRLLEDGLVSLVASDAHGPGRPPRVDRAYAAVEASIGRDAAMPLFDGTAVPWTG